jgi:pimeloyl-ACP methyl ester carboxylesterase
VLANAWIVLSDGCRLAARIWLPEDAVERPVPAILEYIPYRKNDATAARDAAMHPYFAEHGYAAVRVDTRGSGDSDGILRDEYLPQEQRDGLEVLRWLASQPWCTGRVGMMGKSWGGFNALQIAAHDPPELGAVISVASTDDRYADDVHYMGGCLLAWDMLSWASTMLAYNARPPDPDVVGERWRAMWLDRLENTPPFVESWLAHQRRDEYWKQGSGTAQGSHRPLGPSLPSPGISRAGDRLPAGGGALVGSLAQGHRQRDHGGTAASRLDAGGGRAPGRLRPQRRSLAGLAELARSRRGAAPILARRRSARGVRRAAVADAPGLARQPAGRKRGRDVVSLGRRDGLSDRPAG